MTIIGLVGGLGPESTIDYYRRILDAWAHEEPGSAPRIVIDSLDVSRALRLVASDRLALIDYLGDSVKRSSRLVQASSRSRPILHISSSMSSRFSRRCRW